MLAVASMAAKTATPQKQQVVPRPIPELHSGTESVEAKNSAVDIPEDVVRHVRVQLVAHTDFEQVWGSAGSGSISNIGVWRPQIGTSFMSKNRVRIYLGDYVCHGDRSPVRYLYVDTSRTNRPASLSQRWVVLARNGYVHSTAHSVGPLL
jgi:hypothetical protein